ncbi:hypothetical protein CAPTEDRAFT_159010 [Capitella teleta]|uniref:TNF receptor-associated factor n=1 Tax=Capitella teleta TaxID=283909 RepID=R7V551_CAPTE|nr:hypothetical protein CAPTEDRAFT_159010 [Capitella teleta]|eukprot:ELU13993.1 hypothetical protein CAPTEDRAFT_159010 [Capitella teleta]
MHRPKMIRAEKMIRSHSSGSSVSSTGSGSISLAGLSYRSGSSSLSSLTSRSPSDLEVLSVDVLEKCFECPVCCRLMRNPVQFQECGHRCCSTCVPELLRVVPRCPIDQRFIDKDKIFVDKIFQRELDGVKVKCCHHEKGCSWTSAYRELTGHLLCCDYATITCPKGCRIEFQRRFINPHLREDCPNRDDSCRYCYEPLMRGNEDVHFDRCAEFPVACANGCGRTNIPRSKMKQHLDKECQLQVVPCPFVEAKCDHRCERGRMSQHIRDQADRHLELAGQSLQILFQSVAIQTRAVDKCSSRITAIEDRVDGLEKLYGAQLVWKIDGYDEKYQDAKTGRKSTIFSPPFLTSRHGYKMILSASLFGDGKGKGEHMSVFACLCRGDYDALLVWPFCHRLTFTLIDQCPDSATRHDVSYTIRPNTCNENLPFLGRPTAERNASFGAQKFAQLEMLKMHDYVKDDCMFIKVTIDSDKMLLL